uniref:Uncharacterized protein n=1 Tax=Arion vulgaris TaxID=1028688 RepID=A0A0B7B4N5_9EUPU
MGEYLKILRSNILHLVVQAKEKDTFLVSLFFVQGSEKVSVAEDLVGIGMAEFSQVASLQKEEARPNLPYPVGQLHQPRHMDNESDEEDNELEIQRKIQELQMQLKVLKQKKHTTH